MFFFLFPIFGTTTEQSWLPSLLHRYDLNYSIFKRLINGPSRRPFSDLPSIKFVNRFFPYHISNHTFSDHNLGSFIEFSVFWWKCWLSNKNNIRDKTYDSRKIRAKYFEIAKKHPNAFWLSPNWSHIYYLHKIIFFENYVINFFFSFNPSSIQLCVFFYIEFEIKFLSSISEFEDIAIYLLNIFIKFDQTLLEFHKFFHLSCLQASCFSDELLWI